MKRISFKDSQGLNLTQMVLTGRKTMTRRLVTFPDNWDSRDVDIDILRVRNSYFYFLENYETKEHIEIYPKYFIGEEVAIQQAYKDILACEHLSDDKEDKVCRLVSEGVPGCTNKMFVRANLMPHHIRITDARCERLQDISDEDCMKEGLYFRRRGDGTYLKTVFYVPGDKEAYLTPKRAFEELINKVSGRGTWDKNPIVWAYKFELVD